MRVFAIKDESLSPEKVLGYLIYYETPKSFYIELPEDADEWETPLLLSSFVKKGERSINSYWSRMWVQQRIIPPDRQNLGQILKENGLPAYDEFALLTLTMGRCAQDDCYLTELSYPRDIPELLWTRWETKLADALPLSGNRLLVFFRNGEVKLEDMQKLANAFPACLPYFQNEQRFFQMYVQPDGYGIAWSELAAIPHHVLHANGDSLPLTLQDFTTFVQERVVNTTEACQILGCTRQNIDDLTKRGKLHPIRQDAKNKLFLKNEIMQRKRAED